MAFSVPAGAQSVPELIETLGRQAAALIKKGSTEITFPHVVKDVIGHHGLDVLTRTYCQFNESPGNFFIKNGMIHITPTSKNSTFEKVDDENDTKGVASRTRMKHARSHTPRPPNAFILYRKDNHPLLKASHPEMHNNEISIVLGRNWRNESAETKKHYFDLAQMLKDEHLAAHPDYVYKPRKPIDKKARMSHKKAAKLETLFKAMAHDELFKNVDTEVGTRIMDDVPETFEVLDEDNKNSYLILGDAEFDDNCLDNLFNENESYEKDMQVDEKVLIHPQDEFISTSGYVAPSTGLAVDSASSIIDWAESENDNFASFFMHGYQSILPGTNARGIAQTRRNRKRQIAEALRQQRFRIAARQTVSHRNLHGF